MKISRIFIALTVLITVITGCQLENTIDQIQPIDNSIKSIGPSFNVEEIGSKGVSNSPYFSVTQTGDTYLVKVNLHPNGYTAYSGAIVDVRSTSSASGWRVNIGNSPSNNGWGGDSGDTKYDSELQLLNDTLGIYANDYAGSGNLYNRTGWGDGRRFQFRIENNKVSASKYNLLGKKTGSFSYSNQNIFDMNNAAGYEFHVGINRTVASGRTGTGMSNLNITLINSVDTGVYIMGNSIANYPGSYELGHMGLVVGSDANNMGWHFFSIERDNSPYITPSEIIWATELPAIAVGSVSGGAKESVLYHHRENSKQALFTFLEENAPGVNNSGSGIKVGNGYDRIARLKKYDSAEVLRFLNFVLATPPSTYNVLNNNCASFTTYAIEDFYGVECNNNSWHIPNDLFDDLYDNNNFIIERDDAQ